MGCRGFFGGLDGISMLLWKWLSGSLLRVGKWTNKSNRFFVLLVLAEENWSTDEPDWFTDEPDWSTDEPDWFSDEPDWFTNEPDYWYSDEPEWFTDEPDMGPDGHIPHPLCMVLPAFNVLKTQVLTEARFIHQLCCLDKFVTWMMKITVNHHWPNIYF